jgi:hypothetical protein
MEINNLRRSRNPEINDLRKARDRVWPRKARPSGRRAKAGPARPSLERQTPPYVKEQPRERPLNTL